MKIKLVSIITPGTCHINITILLTSTFILTKINFTMIQELCIYYREMQFNVPCSFWFQISDSSIVTLVSSFLHLKIFPKLVIKHTVLYKGYNHILNRK